MSFPQHTMSQMQSTDTHMKPHPAQVQDRFTGISFTNASQPGPLTQQSSPEPADLKLYFEFSQAWLQAAAVDLLTEFPSPIVPGICPGYVYQPPKTKHPLYVPRALWNVRCLSPQERHELYIEFCVFGHTMQRHGLGTLEYKSAFDLILEKSSEIAHKERGWYAQFVGPQETYAQRARDFGAIVAQQARPIDIRSIFSVGRSGGDVTTPIVIDEEDGLPHGQKRCASSAALEADRRPTKRVAREEDGAVGKQRAAMDEADHRRYLEQKQIIDKHYLEGDVTRKPTDAEWRKLAVFDADQAARQASQYTKKRKQPCQKQAEGSNADIVACPKLPSLDLASYPMKTATTYMCLHVESACRGMEGCTARTHDCCRKGLSLRGLESAVRRQHERACARIEELAFRHGKLNQRHKTWEGWFSKNMRDQDSSREKAHLPPLGWTFDARSFPATSSQADSSSPQPQPPTSTKVGQSIEPPRKEAAEQPSEENILPDDDPLLLAFMEAYEEEEEEEEEEIVAPEQPPEESTVEDDDPLLLALVNAFEEDDDNSAELIETAEDTSLDLSDDLDKELFGELF